MPTQYIEIPDLGEALNAGLNVLGAESKEALLFHLDHYYGVRVNGCGPIFLDELEFALGDFFGEHGCALIMDILNGEAEKLRSRRTRNERR